MRSAMPPGARSAIVDICLSFMCKSYLFYAVIVALPKHRQFSFVLCRAERWPSSMRLLQLLTPLNQIPIRLMSQISASFSMWKPLLLQMDTVAPTRTCAGGRSCSTRRHSRRSRLLGPVGNKRNWPNKLHQPPLLARQLPRLYQLPLLLRCLGCERNRRRCKSRKSQRNIGHCPWSLIGHCQRIL